MSDQYLRNLFLLLAVLGFGDLNPALGQPSEPVSSHPRSLQAQPAKLAPQFPVPATLRRVPQIRLVLPLNKANWQARETRGGLSTRALLEIGAVTLTGVGHLAFSAADATNLFIPAASLGWAGYIYYRTRTEAGFLRRKGLSTQNWKRAFRDATIVAAGALAGMAAIGDKPLTLHRNMVPLMLLYPAWGIVQQFLVQGLVADNLSRAPGWLGSPFVVTPISAVMFGSVHLPSLELTSGTLAMGMAYTPLYLKHRNLLPLGLYHGWLGVFYYFWILERNPWRYVVG